MPLINHVRGDAVPDSMLNVRTPIIKIPLWMVVTGWLCRGLFRTAVFYVKHWYITVPATLLAVVYADYGWLGLVLTVTVPGLLLGGWWFGHRPSFTRFAWLPALSRYRRMTYRRAWYPAMATAKLTVSFDRTVVLPRIRRVRCTGMADVVTVRMVTGQIPDDYAKASERLLHTFGARGCRVSPGPRPELVVLTFLRGDPLAAMVPPLPVPAVPDFTALPLGLREDGQVFTLRLFGTQVLVVGATDAGKGSVIWSILRSVASGIASGLVRVWAFDPKGGMELAAGMNLFARFACEDFAAMATMLEEAVETMRERTGRLRGKTRQHIPTVADPLILIIIDELAALTAYVTDRQLKDRIKAALGVLLTQGRAVGVHVVACLQDPRKEVLPFRNLFPTRIGLRLSEAGEVDLSLGDGARDRGALCDRIVKGPSTAGTAYVVLDGDPAPMRMRFSYLTDDDIADLARTHGRLRLIDGEVA
jgi:hypothetical protein